MQAILLEEVCKRQPVRFQLRALLAEHLRLAAAGAAVAAGKEDAGFLEKLAGGGEDERVRLVLGYAHGAGARDDRGAGPQITGVPVPAGEVARVYPAAGEYGVAGVVAHGGLALLDPHFEAVAPVADQDDGRGKARAVQSPGVGLIDRVDEVEIDGLSVPLAALHVCRA